MFKLYLTLLMGFLRMAYVMSGDNNPDPSTLDSPEPDILPLVLIKKDRNFIHPTKIKTPLPTSTAEPSIEPLEFSGDSGEQEILFCGAKPPPKQDATQQYIPFLDDYCNYPIKFEKSDPVKCVYEPEPLLIPIMIPRTPISLIKHLSCGPNDEGRMFHFAYQICMTKNPIKYKKYSSADFHLPVSSIKYYNNFEVYKLCIKVRTKEVFFTEHKIFSPRLLNDQRLKDERRKKYNFRIAKNLGFDEEKILQQKYQSTGILNAPAQPSQKNSNSSTESEELKDITPLYVRDKFVPSDDFAFALWRKPTFDFFNIKRMTTKQMELWDYIGKLIREDAIKHNREYYIHTAAYKIFSREPPSERHPDRVKTIVVWVKTVYQLQDEIRQSKELNNKNKAITIIVDNDSDTDPQVESILTLRFGKNLCENTFKNMEFRSVRCCSILNSMPYLNEDSIEIDEDLRIEALYDNEDNDDQNKPPKRIKLIDINLPADEEDEDEDESENHS